MIEQKIAEILNKYGLKFLAVADSPEVEVDDYHNAKIALQKEYTDAILALITEEQKPLVEALEVISKYPCVTDLLGRPITEEDDSCHCAACVAKLAMKGVGR